MSIRQTKKQSDLEKRLQLLRRQVYGKNSESQQISKPAGQQSNTLTHQYTNAPASSGSPTHRTADLSYLHQDLLKILIFSSLAIASQVILFFLSNNHILNLNFF